MASSRKNRKCCPLRMAVIFPRLCGVGMFESVVPETRKEGHPCRSVIRPSICLRVLNLLASGRSVALFAAEIGVSDQTTHNWRKQELIDTGVDSGLTSVEAAELRAAKRRVAALETESAVTRRGSGTCVWTDSSGTVGPNLIRRSGWLRLGFVVSLWGADRVGHRSESLTPLTGPVDRRRLIVFRSDSGDVALSIHT